MQIGLLYHLYTIVNCIKKLKSLKSFVFINNYYCIYTLGYFYKFIKKV
jgi:hypothetical protein